MYLLLALFLILFKLLSDGLKFKKRHIASGMVEFIQWGVIIILLFGWITAMIPTQWELNYPQNFWKIIVGFLFLRFGIFDPLINRVMGEPFDYIGTTKLWDKAIWWILHRLTWKGKMIVPPFGLLWIRFVFAVWGFCWLIAGNTDRI